MAQYDAGSIEATLNVDQDPFDEGLRMAEEKAQRFEDREVNAKLGVRFDQKEANAEIHELEARLAELSDQRAAISPDVDTTEADAEIDRIKERLATLRDKTVHVRVESDQAEGALGKLGDAIDDVAGDGGLPGLGGGGGSDGGGGRGIAGLIAKFGILGTLAAGFINPLVGEALGLGGAFGIAGIGVGAFAKTATSDFKQLKTDTDAVKKAQLELTSATTDQQRLKAINDLAAANAKLVGPEGKAAAAMERMTKASDEFKKATGPATFGALSSGMNLISDLLPKIVPLVNATGRGLQGVARQLTTAFDGPGFAKFLNFLTTNVGPVLNKLTGDVINIGKGLAGGLMQSMPVVNAVLSQLNLAGRALDKLTSSPQFGQFMKGLAADVNEFSKGLGPVFTLLGHLLLAIQPLVKPVMEFVGELARGLDALLPGLSAFMTALAKGLADIGKNGGLTALGSAIGEVFKALAPLLPILGTVIGKLLPPLADAFTKLVQAVEPLIPPLGQLLLALIPVAKPIIELLTALTPLISLLVQVLTPVITAITAVVNAIAPLLGFLTPLLGLFADLSGVMPALVAAFLALTSPIGLTVLAITALVVVAGEIIKHWSAISHFFSKLWDDVTGFFTKHWAVIKEIIYAWATLGVSEIIKHWGAISHFFSKLWDDVTGFFVDHWKTILGVILDIVLWPLAVIKHWSAISGFFSNLWDDVKNVFSDAWSWIKKKVSGWIDDVVGAYKMMGHDLVKIFSDMWHDITHGLSVAWHNISSFFRALPGHIKDFFAAAPGWLLHAGNAIITGLWHGIQAAAKGVFNFFKDLPGHIKDFFSGVGSWLLDVGKELITGLFNGIKDVWSDMTGWLGDAADKVTGVLKSAWNILSPSRVFHEIGTNLGKGLHNGIIESFAPIHGTLLDQVKLINDTVDGIGMNVGGSISVTAQTNATALAGHAQASAMSSLATEIAKLHDTIKAAPDATGTAVAEKLEPKLTKVASKQTRAMVTANRQNGGS